VTTAPTTASSPGTLARRLLPLQAGVGLQGLILWVPVEKLFMSEIGFTPVSVGVMAAAYSAVVPLLEIPSGILADRWSRNWVMVGSTIALLASTTIGGLSRNVTTYIGSAIVLGAYFALNSGTVDSMVYDTVLEETGGSELYERWIGRVRMVESGAFAVSALAGGLLAGWTSARATYFATLPFVAAAVLVFLRFREPRLHQSTEPVALRAHVAVTFQTMTRQPAVAQVVLLSALAAMLLSAVFEFGPLWLVAQSAPASLYGPYWAALVATLGVGGFLSGRLDLGRTVPVVVLAAVGPAATLDLALTSSVALAITCQIALALMLAIIGIHAGRLVHDAVPSTIRTGVASGIGTLSWLLFLPFSLVIGWLAREHGAQRSGWLLTGAAVLVALLLLVTTLRPVPQPTVAAGPSDEVDCRDVVAMVSDYLDDALPDDDRAAVTNHLDECDGCTQYVDQIRTTIEAIEELTARPDATHQQPS
jgi:hypothetical protein